MAPDRFARPSIHPRVTETVGIAAVQMVGGIDVDLNVDLAEPRLSLQLAKYKILNVRPAANRGEVGGGSTLGDG